MSRKGCALATAEVDEAAENGRSGRKIIGGRSAARAGGGGGNLVWDWKMSRGSSTGWAFGVGNGHGSSSNTEGWLSKFGVWVGQGGKRKWGEAFICKLPSAPMFSGGQVLVGPL